MKQVVFPLTLLEAFQKFCTLARLTITERHVSGTMQDAYVVAIVSGDTTTALTQAHHTCLIHNGSIISLYGVFENTRFGIQRMKESIVQAADDEKNCLLAINDVLSGQK